MKIKTEQEIERLADYYKPSLSHEECLDRDDLEFIENESGDQFVSLDEVDRVATHCHFHTFQKAYSQAQSDLLESSYEWFNEYIASHDQGILWDTEDDGEEIKVAERAWQACSLSYAKLIKEKDERIKELESELRNFERAELIHSNREDVLPSIQEATHYNWLDDQLHEKDQLVFNLKEQYQEAVKDIEWLCTDKTMSFPAYIEERDRIKSKYGLDKQERES